MEDEEYYNRICKFISIAGDNVLEELIDYFALYSKKHWLILIEERLNRIENEE